MALNNRRRCESTLIPRRALEPDEMESIFANRRSRHYTRVTGSGAFQDAVGRGGDVPSAVYAGRNDWSNCFQRECGPRFGLVRGRCKPGGYGRFGSAFSPSWLSLFGILDSILISQTEGKTHGSPAEKAGFYACRASGGHCHYRHSDRPVVARGPGGPRSTRRSQCTNNLKQMGLALQNFHDTYDRFPPGEAMDQSPFGTNAAAYGSSWIVYILPYIEQNPLYSKYQFTGASGWGNTNNAAAVSNVIIPGLLCPSSPLPTTGSFSPGAIGPIEVPSYVGIWAPSRD